MRLTSVCAALSVAVVLTAVPAAAQAAPPSNDTWDSAVKATSVPFGATADTSEATTDPDTPSAVCYNSRRHTVWYRYTPSSNRRVVVSTAGSDYDTVVNVYRAKDASVTPDRWGLVSCDRGGASEPSVAGFRAQAGRVYYVMVSSFRKTDGGSLRLLLRPAARISLSVLHRGKVDRVDGSAVVSARVRCTQPAVADLYLLVRQRVRDAVAAGDAGKALACGPVAVRVRIRVDSVTGWAFHRGRARTSAIVRAYDGDIRADADRASRVVVRLR